MILDVVNSAFLHSPLCCVHTHKQRPLICCCSRFIICSIFFFLSFILLRLLCFSFYVLSNSPSSCPDDFFFLSPGLFCFFFQTIFQVWCKPINKLERVGTRGMWSESRAARSRTGREVRACCSTLSAIFEISSIVFVYNNWRGGTCFSSIKFIY